MGQLGTPKTPFVEFEKKEKFHQYFLFRLGYENVHLFVYNF